MKLSRILLPVPFVILAALFVGGQMLLRSRRPVAAPALAESAFAAFGALRSVAAEVIWFRADRLQDEGRYVELAQLASALTSMEPHTPEVWSYAAWNLAYNVSVMMPTHEDRWRWVEAAIRLLRDEGLAYNPGDPELCREIAFLFELKMAANIDAAAATYRSKWAAIVADVRTRGAWDELKMSTLKMQLVTQHTGLDDWEDPCLSAIYWALEGLTRATEKERPMLLEIIRQSQVLYQKAHVGPRAPERKP